MTVRIFLGFVMPHRAQFENRATRSQCESSQTNPRRGGFRSSSATIGQRLDVGDVEFHVAGDAEWGRIRAIRGIGHSIALTRHRVTSRGGSFHTGPSRRLYAPDLAGRQAVIFGVDDDLDLALRIRPDRARRRRLTP